MFDTEKAAVWDEAINYCIDHYLMGGTDGDDALAANPYTKQEADG